ncbi:MAG: hypothetical protein ACOYT9_00300 [Patescibacteria group bacterium]
MAQVKITPPQNADKFFFRRAISGKFTTMQIGATSDPKTGIVTAECAELPGLIKDYLDVNYRGYQVEIILPKEEGVPVEE